MKRLVFKGEYLPLIRSGEKTTTLRRNNRMGFKAGETVIATNWKEKVPIFIDKVEKKNFEALSEEDAVHDGFASLDDLKTAILETYGTLDFTPVIITFHRV